MHKCARCIETFDSWFLYQIHSEMHKLTIQVSKVTLSKTRNIVGVKQPLSDEQRTRAVTKCEQRLGIQHFYGE